MAAAEGVEEAEAPAAAEVVELQAVAVVAGAVAGVAVVEVEAVRPEAVEEAAVGGRRGRGSRRNSTP